MIKFLAASLLFLSMSAQAAPNLVVRWCLADKASFFFYNKVGTENSKHPGFVFDVLSHLQTKLIFTNKVIRRPQTACSVLLEKGEIDAVGLLSYNPDRAKLGVFPMKNGEADQDRAVIRTSYYLYTKKGNSLSWDGKSLESLKGKRLGALEGFSIVQDLRQAGAFVETFKTLEGLIARLQKNDIDAAAMNNDMMNRVSERIQLQKNEAPLATKDYFIQFSRQFLEKYPAIPEEIWKESARFIKSTEGQAILSKYEKLENFP